MQDQKTENFSYCRLCGENMKMDYLLDFSQNERTLLDFIEMFKVDFINVQSELLPKTSCYSCYKLLQKCSDFIKKMKQTQVYLLNVYKNTSENLTEVDIKIENVDDGHYFNIEPETTSDNVKNTVNLKEDPHTTETHKSLTNIILKDTKKVLETNQLNPSDRIKHKIKQKNNISSSKTLKKRTLLSKCHYQTMSQENKKNKHIEKLSWADYDWTCIHCQAKFDSMHAVRDHSKVVHSICFAFKCVDCDELFNCFNLFVEHVRLHRDSLRLCCQFCNHKSSTVAEATSHVASHWLSSHTICTLCGEILPNTNALDRHKIVYKKVVLPQRFYKRKPKRVEGNITWKEYQWSCQDCSLPLPDIVSLRSHTREIHIKCFAMKCADCLTVLANYKHFIDHVTAHRECLKNYCPHCSIKLNKSTIDTHMSTHITGLQKPCLGCGDIFPDSTSLMQHQTQYEAPRVRGSSDTESLTCGVCQKKFANPFQLKNHKVIHNAKRERDHICHTCGKAFFTAKTLTDHIRTHLTKTEMCAICQKTFLTKQRLKVHVLTHLELKQFVCNECGKKFRRKSQLRLHLASHSDALPFACALCGKGFRLSSYLKKHELQHTGIRPYTCEVCNETFNHWGNCNRHMIRKHGVTLAKTKITAHGKLDINRETGEAKTIDIGGDVKEWCREMLKPKKRGRKKKEG